MKTLLVALMLSVLPFSVYAAGGKKAIVSASDEVDPDKGDGCGLGWQVTKKRTMLATTTRGTTNGFVPPTFGMTTGTIGCEQHPIAKNEIEGARYAVNNYEMLKLEMAQGSGEYLAAFARTFGCDDAAVSSFSNMTQKNYRSITGAGKASAIEMFKNVKKELNSAPALAGCKVSA